ncbi:uncharacterized protein [Typha angustifolia]|uniref:uncharacterized protein isoform X2 n=1 Tax=Typha angustifolia TaxID=59011 RepID=UPI003C2E4BCC
MMIRALAVEREEGSAEMFSYRSQLEQEVKQLQRRLKREVDLHVTLTNVVAHGAAPLLHSPVELPDEAQELLTNIAVLEITISSLKEELIALHFLLCQERNERNRSETHLECLSSALQVSPSSSGCTSEEHVSLLRNLKIGGCQTVNTFQQDPLCQSKDGKSIESNGLVDKNHGEKMPGLSNVDEEGEKIEAIQQFSAKELHMKSIKQNLWCNPNQLSEQMVQSMRNLFLSLSGSSMMCSNVSSEYSSSSPVGHLSHSPLTSFSDSSIMPSMLRSPSIESDHNNETMDLVSNFDPYRVNSSLKWSDIGIYSSAAEVSWMSVGKPQLEYAAEALEKFRFLVEQLANVNPAWMSCNERLAFWINLYNALIMHAYLAYGFPRNDVELFSLMQKACYAVGGRSFSAAEIEFVILKMNAPTHRPQLALMLNLHKLKISEEHRKYSVDNPEPLALFALSCGMFSSPAVRIFSADNVHDELHNSMRDYIRASIGISDEGKLLVPNLLHSFGNTVVEDSLLVDWICRYLSPDQVTVVRDSESHRKQRFLGVRSFSSVPFDSRFRYLFLPDYKSSQRSL